MRVLHVYSRRGCHLCEQLIEALTQQVRGRLIVEVRDIDTREDWLQEYDVRIPVVEFHGQPVCEYTLDSVAVERIIAEYGQYH